jgi:hypothetical protein
MPRRAKKITDSPAAAAASSPASSVASGPKRAKKAVTQQQAPQADGAAAVANAVSFEVDSSVVSRAVKDSFSVRAVPADVFTAGTPLHTFLQEKTSSGLTPVAPGEIADLSTDDDKRMVALVFAYSANGAPNPATIQTYKVSVERPQCPQPEPKRVSNEPQHVSAYYAARSAECTVLVKRRNGDGSTCKDAFNGLGQSLIRISPCMLFWRPV